MALPIPENADEYMQCIHCDYISSEARHLTDPACPSCGHRGIWSKQVDWSTRDDVATVDSYVRNIEKLREENDTLRALLAWGDDRCVYCGLAKADMGKCAHGFPGCSRADDMSERDNPWPTVGRDS